MSDGHAETDGLRRAAAAGVDLAAGVARRQHEPRSFWLGWVTFVIFFTLPALTGYLLGRGLRGAVGRRQRRRCTASPRCVACAEVAPDGDRSTTAPSRGPRRGCTCRRCCAANLLARPDGERGRRGRSAGRLGGRGDDPLPRRHRGRHRADRRHGRRVRRRWCSPSSPASCSVSPTPRAAAVLLLPLVGGGAGDQGARRPDQGVPVGRPGGDGERDRAGRRHDGGGHDGEGQRRRRQPCWRACKVLVDRRGVTAVRDRVLDEGVFAFSQGAADVGFGLMHRGQRRGDRVGRVQRRHLALFAAYLGWLSFLPRMVGRVLARRKQAGVAFDRMRQLVADEDAEQHGQAPLAAARGAAAGQPARGRAARSGCRCSASTWSRWRRATRRRRARRADLVHRRAGQLHRDHRRRRHRQVDAAAGHPRAGVAGRGRRRGALERHGGRRSRRVLRAAERGVPVAGAAAGVGLGARQRRPRPGGHGGDSTAPSRLAAIADDVRAMPDGDGHADRAARAAPVRRAAPAPGDGAGAGARPRAGRARRPVERRRRRDRAAALGEPGRAPASP